MLADITRSKSELIVENAFLRQQLIVLQRQAKRPVLTPRDRTLLVLLASRFPRWREALIIIKPETLLGWHRRVSDSSGVTSPKPERPGFVSPNT